jgi:hypothetical protein
LVDYHDVYGEAAVGKPTAAYFKKRKKRREKKRRENRE